MIDYIILSLWVWGGGIIFLILWLSIGMICGILKDLVEYMMEKRQQNEN
jgi:hypothetical protein